MKRVMTSALLVGAVSSCFFVPRPLAAQQCQDEEAMVADYKKDLGKLVETTRKESQADFEKAFHQKTCLTKLTLFVSMVNELMACLEKASGDSTAAKDQVEAYKTKSAANSKLKDKLEENRKSLKGTGDSKAAKAFIQKLDYTD